MNQDELKKLSDAIVKGTVFCTKAILTSDEAAQYLGISKSYLYKLTMRHQIPFYKPLGKVCYFDRLELENWIRENRVSTDDELENEAQAYCETSKGKKGGKKK